MNPTPRRWLKIITITTLCTMLVLGALIVYKKSTDPGPAEYFNPTGGLKNIDIALQVYAKEHESYPPSLSDLQEIIGATDEEFKEMTAHVEYHGAGLTKLDDPRLILAVEKREEWKRRLVLRNDNTVRLVDEPEWRRDWASHQKAIEERSTSNP